MVASCECDAISPRKKSGDVYALKPHLRSPFKLASAAVRGNQHEEITSGKGEPDRG
jgi:hypothetical protein